MKTTTLAIRWFKKQTNKSLVLDALKIKVVFTGGRLYVKYFLLCISGCIKLRHTYAYFGQMRSHLRHLWHLPTYYYSLCFLIRRSAGHCRDVLYIVIGVCFMTDVHHWFLVSCLSLCGTIALLLNDFTFTWSEKKNHVLR